MKRGIKAQIARQLGVTPTHIGDIIKGKCRPSCALAERLESVTGIGRLVWLYPNEGSNRKTLQSVSLKQQLPPRCSRPAH